MKEIISIIIIALSWYLNAVADSIDHPKGDKTLFELWHIFKDLSYLIPFFWIGYLCGMRWYYCVIAAVSLAGWYPIYGYLKGIGFWRYDDIIVIRWLQWIWGIKR